MGLRLPKSGPGVPARPTDVKIAHHTDPVLLPAMHQPLRLHLATALIRTATSRVNAWCAHRGGGGRRSIDSLVYFIRLPKTRHSISKPSTIQTKCAAPAVHIPGPGTINNAKRVKIVPGGAPAGRGSSAEMRDSVTFQHRFLSDLTFINYEKMCLSLLKTYSIEAKVAKCI